uniref:6-phosphogluconolactonase n=1 Tax=Rhizochromulina marina TaxID=1034831 RepID=A0A7S2SL81_9STRA|mmetsp:Transcript_31857/g.92565  ORF Transcript_31857/g.92565 Transcript_31857/m.92565 type:complete len:520 (+) Transcript_31857:262-1821(+)
MPPHSITGVEQFLSKVDEVDGLASDWPHADPPRDTVFYVCTYTNNDILAHIPKGDRGEGIYAWRLEAATGTLRQLAASRVEPNPAFVVHDAARNLLYASTECIHKKGCGEVITLAADESGEPGALREAGRVSAGGRSTCYLNLLRGGRMAVVNYWDAIVSLHPVCPTNGIVGPACDQHMQPGADYVFETNPDRVEHWTHRQRWPHTHCFVTEPYHGVLHFVPDLGVDKIWVYKVDGGCHKEQDAAKLVLCGGVQLEHGQGPRHIVFHPRVRTAYVVNELLSTVSVLKVQPECLAGFPGDLLSEPIDMDGFSEESVLFEVQKIRTLPEHFESLDHHKSHASEIRIHPSGRFVLVANRGHDSIAVFAVDEANSGRLSLTSITPSGGVFPRNFNFDATGHYVLVGNQNSNNLTLFAFDVDTGLMKNSLQTVYQPSPNFILGVAAGDADALTRNKTSQEHTNQDDQGVALSKGAKGELRSTNDCKSEPKVRLNKWLLLATPEQVALGCVLVFWIYSILHRTGA